MFYPYVSQSPEVSMTLFEATAPASGGPPANAHSASQHAIAAELDQKLASLATLEERLAPFAPPSTGRSRSRPVSASRIRRLRTPIATTATWHRHLHPRYRPALSRDARHAVRYRRQVRHQDPRDVSRRRRSRRPRRRTMASTAFAIPSKRARHAAKFAKSARSIGR